MCGKSLPVSGRRHAHIRTTPARRLLLSSARLNLWRRESAPTHLCALPGARWPKVCIYLAEDAASFERVRLYARQHCATEHHCRQRQSCRDRNWLRECPPVSALLGVCQHHGLYRSLWWLAVTHGTDGTKGFQAWSGWYYCCRKGTFQKRNEWYLSLEPWFHLYYQGILIWISLCKSSSLILVCNAWAIITW